MEIILLFALFLVPVITPANPVPGLRGTKSESRDLECERLSLETGQRLHPGEIAEPKPRGDYIDRDVVVCRERLMDPGDRPVRDEAILSTLDATATAFASEALALRPDLEGRTWLVETYYPSPQVSAKIAFATKNALVGQGLRVSDRTPTLQAGDIDVITRMSPTDAYPTACRRYAAGGTLEPGDALLAVVSRDPRETILHAGLCAEGQWQWLR
jgi:hypothetical protein